MDGTIRIEDMRLFAAVAAAKSFTSAARVLGMPKQTLSRRVANLESALGVQLLHRTTRRLHLSDVGAAYAERCAEIVRMTLDANQAVADVHAQPRGTLRVTADPVFGEAFLSDLVIAYAKAWPQVHVDVVLTKRRVDLAEEGFDVAFRIGEMGGPELSGLSLGAARIRYCASPAYVAERGAPRTPEDLARHDCLLVASASAGPVEWPFRGKKGPALFQPSGRLRFTSFEMARAAAVAGLGIAIFPEFACAQHIRNKELVAVLDDFTVGVGDVWLVHVARRFLPARVQAFVDLTRRRFSGTAPWLVTGKQTPRLSSTRTNR